jgi:glycosyltransferase involved in cell wall biosynthesis
MDTTFTHTVLGVHNYYRLPGGEDRVFAAESALLEEHGHKVIRFEDRNSRIGGALAAGLHGIWNRQSGSRLDAVIQQHRPGVAHFHNTFPLISPAGYYAAHRRGVPVVQTLHNFRLLCPGATFFRDGHVCEDCTRHSVPTPGIAHGCYRGSRPASAAVAAMLIAHRAVGTYRRMVDLYIAPSKFVRDKFVEHGFSAEEMIVKPNPILSDPGKGDGSGMALCAGANKRSYALFVGRLTEEKGVRTLAAAWQNLSDVPLLVAGDGPLSLHWPAGVTMLGTQTHEEVFRLMRSASVLIFPSVWYEGQPMTLLESLACGLPVIGSRLGATTELIEHGRTGLLFQPGEADDLVRQVRWAMAHPDEMRSMRATARREYEAKYTPEQSYKALIDAYDLAIENSRRKKPRLCA